MSDGNKRNVGGQAKTITMTLAEHQRELDRVFDMGVEAGREAEQRVRQLPVVTCPMCRMEKELEDARARLRVLENTDRRTGRFG